MLNQLAVRIRRAASISTNRRKSILLDNDPPPPSPNTSGNNFSEFFIPPLQHAPLPPRINGAKSVVHLLYDVKDPPPPPDAPHTRFVCVSDTHSQTFDVPFGDVLLHSGDLSSRGTLENFQVTLDWLCTLPHKLKIIIAGNHDLPLHKEWYETHYPRFHKDDKQDSDAIRQLLTSPEAIAAGVVYLENERFEFQTREGGRVWSVYGSPWSVYFGGWAFGYHPGIEAEKLINDFPQTDILLTHGPPHGILDQNLARRAVGCPSLASRVASLRPRLHVFGHIHEDHGATVKQWPREDCENRTPGVSRSSRSVVLSPAQRDRQEEESDSDLDPDIDVTAYKKGVSQSTSTPTTVPSTKQTDLASQSNNETETETVFVNAANAPTGARARDENNEMVPFGGRGFQPVIVDLLE